MGWDDGLNPPGYPQYKGHLQWTPEYEWEDRNILTTLDCGWTVEVVHTPNDLAVDRSMGIKNCSYYGVWQPRYIHRTHVILSLRDVGGKPLANINCANAAHVVELYGDSDCAYDRYGERQIPKERGYRESMYYGYHVGGPFERIPREFFGHYWYPLEFLSARGGNWGDEGAPRKREMKAVAAWWNELPSPAWAIQLPTTNYANITEQCTKMYEAMGPIPVPPQRDRLGRFVKKGA